MKDQKNQPQPFRPPSKELQERMKAVLKMPPLTSEEATRMFKASALVRQKLTVKPHN
jgi:hypothetical protein